MVALIPVVQQTADATAAHPSLQEVSWGVLQTTHWLRRLCLRVMTSRAFERVCLLAIFANCVVLGLEDPLDKDNVSRRNQLVTASEPWFTAAFAVEMLVKVSGLVPDGDPLLVHAHVAHAWTRPLRRVHCTIPCCLTR